MNNIAVVILRCSICSTQISRGSKHITSVDVMWVLGTKSYQDTRSTHIKFVDVMWVLGMEVAAPAVSFMSHHCLPRRDKDGDFKFKMISCIHRYPI